MSWLDAFFQTGYKTVAIAGVPLAVESILNFVSGATAVDNPGLGRTDVTIAAGRIPQALASNGDANQTLAGTSGDNFYAIYTLTAPHAYQMPTAPGLNMSCAIADARSQYTGANKITLSTAGGTDHFWVGGVDMGTTWVIDPVRYLGGTIIFVRLSATTWEAVL